MNRTSRNLFDEIREQSKWVAEQANHISIQESVIREYAAQLNVSKIGKAPLDASAHYLNQGLDTVAFFFILEAINFGSGYFPHLDNKLAGSGYFTIATYLNQHFIKNGVFTPKQLTKITPQDCNKIFHQHPENEPIQMLMRSFAKSLNELGEYVCKRFDGQFKNLILAANHSAEQLVQLLIYIPSFQDVAIYKGQSIAFLKRAQITVADTSLAFDNQGWGYFEDLDQLTIFADNMIPQVLRSLGVFQYSHSLAEKIDSEVLLEAGSAEEVELRACSIHAIERIKEQLKAQGHFLRSLDIDYLLWNQGAAALKESPYPLHLTRTIFY